MRATVMGAGTWGTVFAKVLADAGCDVVLWARRPELAVAIQDRHENPEYLAGVELPRAIAATHELERALTGADLVALAVPSQTLRANLADFVPYLSGGELLVSLMKGIELTTSRRMSEVIMEVAGASEDRVAVVSGPNLAGEIAQHQPTATVVASADSGTAVRVQDATRTRYFRPYTNEDVLGCEIGGAVKNVIALACGIAGGMGFGDNTKSSIMTRGLAETARLGAALGADPLTFLGLAGMGDLVATCTSPLSRNRSFGERLGRGESVAQASAATRQVAEGVKSCRAILDLAASCDVDMPITEHVVAAVHHAMSPEDVLRSLMSRDAKSERAAR